MSSLRPLITIALLGVVGVLLYMKINETEPKLPDEVQDGWQADLEVGGGAATAATAPALPPAMDAPAAASPATTGAPPAWAPGALAVEEPPKFDNPAKNDATSKPPKSEAPAAAQASVPATIPTMPAIPEASVSTDSKKGAVAAAATAAAAAGVAAASAHNDAPPPAAEESPVTPNNPFAATPTETAAAPAAAAPAATAAAPEMTPAQSASSMFDAARVAVQGALDRGELAQALLLLSDWYGDPSLTPAETDEVNTLLAELAGSVIYEGPPAHRLEPAYIVQAGETLEDVARKYDVPAALLQKVNGLADAAALQPGQELKVMRGPFSALIDLSERRMTLMLDRRYAGRFDVDIDPAATIEEGQWKVDQKLLTPATASLYGQPANGGSEDHSLVLANPSNPNVQAAVLRGPGGDPLAAEPRGRVIRLKSEEVTDVYDILSVGSRITIRR